MIILYIKSKFLRFISKTEEKKEKTKYKKITTL